MIQSKTMIYIGNKNKKASSSISFRKQEFKKTQETKSQLDVLFRHHHRPSPPFPDLPLPLTLVHAPPLGQQPPHLLQPQPSRLGIAPPHRHPRHHTHPSIRQKRPSRREELHHGQESKPDDGVGPPVCGRCEAGADGADG